MRDGIDGANGLVKGLVRRFENIPLLLRQAECPLKLEHFLAVCAFSAWLLGFAGMVLARSPTPLIPIGGVFGFFTPCIWLLMRGDVVSTNSKNSCPMHSN